MKLASVELNFVAGFPRRNCLLCCERELLRGKDRTVSTLVPVTVQRLLLILDPSTGAGNSDCVNALSHNCDGGKDTWGFTSTETIKAY